MRNEGLGMKVAASPRIYIYMWRCPKVCDGRFLSYRQPSPRGEGAPKGRIGHRRYERKWESGEVRRTTPALPIELIEPTGPLSQAIKGRYAQGANPEPLKFESRDD